MTFRKLIISLVFMAVHWHSNAQIIDTGHHTDTLSILDRVSIRTNMLDWTCLTPNIGLEFDVQRCNWGHWAVTLDFRTNWESKTPFKSGTVYNILNVRGGIKYYYRMRKTGRKYQSYETQANSNDNGKKGKKTRLKAMYRGEYPQIQDGFLDRLLTCRTDEPRHPEIAFYRGVYASATKFSVKLGKEGRQGRAVVAGLTWGFVKPLYEYRNGNSIDFEAGISAGLSYTKYYTYVLDRESNCYENKEFNNWALRMIPVISDLRLGFVYRIGDYPSTKKYRWRYDCDLDYQSRYNDKLTLYKQRMDSLSRSRNDKDIIHKDFMRVFDEEAAKIKAAYAKDKAAGKVASENSNKEKKQKKEKEKAEEKKAEEKKATTVTEAKPEETVETPVAEEKPEETDETPVTEEKPEETDETPVAEEKPEETDETPVAEEKPEETVEKPEDSTSGNNNENETNGEEAQQ